MWILLFILAAIALWYSPSLRRSLARFLEPDDRLASAPKGRSPTAGPTGPADAGAPSASTRE